MFDRLLLLNQQGQCIYFGDIGNDASTLISYFEQSGGDKCDPKSNPAEWMLDISNKQPKDDIDTTPSNYWAQKWSTSQQKQQVRHHLAELKTRSKTMQAATHHAEYATPLFHQMTVVTKRIFQEYWRSPTYVYSKLALCAGVVSCPPMVNPVVYLEAHTHYRLFSTVFPSRIQ